MIPTLESYKILKDGRSYYVLTPYDLHVMPHLAITGPYHTTLEDAMGAKGGRPQAAGGIITSLLLVASMWVSRNIEIDSNDAKFISIMCITLLGMSIANYFLRLSILEFAICVVGLMVSFGFCAYEIHQMENSNFRGDMENCSTIISLRVFISIVSIFVYVLRLLYMFSGKNRD